MGFKGQYFLEAGYFYAPYLPLTSTPVVPLKNNESINKEMAEVIMIGLASTDYDSLLPEQLEAAKRLTRLIEVSFPDVAMEFKND